MPLLSIFRPIFSLISLLILAAAAYLLWQWYEGHTACDAAGNCTFFRDDWKLWTGLLLLAWSFLGKFILTPLLARPDDDPLRPERLPGEMISSPTGARLHVETLGQPNGPTLILTHGWGLDSSIWAYTKRELGTRFRIIAWDLPGLGRSEAGAIDLESFAEDLHTVIQHSGQGPVVLVGHSIGGMTIQTLARNHPELFPSPVAGIVLINTTYTNPLRTMILPRLMQALRRPIIEPMMHLTIWLEPLAWLSAWQSYLSGSAQMATRLGFGRFVTRSQLQHTTLLTTINRPLVQAKGNLAMFRWDATGALVDLPAPVLVLGGDVDIVTKVEASEVIAAETGLSTLRKVEGVNHMGFLERADIYNAAISEFALSLRAADSLEPAATRLPSSIADGSRLAQG